MTSLITEGGEDFVGYAPVTESDFVKGLFLLFTEIPQYFVGLTEIVDFKISIGGLVEEMLSSLEKVILNFGPGPRVFSLFSIYDREGELSLEDLLGRRVIITNSHWHEIEAEVIEASEIAKKWLNYLYTRSNVFPALRPCGLMDESKIQGNSGPRLIFLLKRYDLSSDVIDRIKELKRELPQEVDDHVILCLPRYFLLHLNENEARDFGNLLLASLLLSRKRLDPAVLSLVRRSLKRVIRGLEGGHYDEYLNALAALSSELDIDIIATLPIVKDGRIREELVVAHESRIIERDFRPSFPDDLSEVTREVSVGIDARDPVLTACPVGERGGSTKLVITYGAREPIAEWHVNYVSYPAELPVSPPKRGFLEAYHRSRMVLDVRGEMGIVKLAVSS